jgi:hypothetical protein
MKRITTSVLPSNRNFFMAPTYGTAPNPSLGSMMVQSIAVPPSSLLESSTHLQSLPPL